MMTKILKNQKRVRKKLMTYVSYFNDNNISCLLNISVRLFLNRNRISNYSTTQVFFVQLMQKNNRLDLLIFYWIWDQSDI